MSSTTFKTTVIAGFIATFVMTITGFWQSGLGLPAMDVGAMMSANMTSAHPDVPYTLFAGNLIHFANGILLALVFVAFLQSRIPGNWFAQGIIYAIILALAAAIVVVPLVAGAGIFFSNTPAPGGMLLGAVVAHLAYGLTLTLSLKVAGTGAAAAA